MVRRRGSAGVLPALVTALAATAAPASAASCTVGQPACPTVAEALNAAEDNPGPDLVRVPPGEFEAAGAEYTSPDRLELAGAGARATVLGGGLTLIGERVLVHDLAVRAGAPVALAATGWVRAVRIFGSARGGAGIQGVAPGPLELDDVLVDATGLDVAIDARCAAVRARHVTVAGSGVAGARAACPLAEATASLALDSSVIAPGFERSLLRGERATTGAAYSNLAGPADGAVVSEPVEGPPGFVSAEDPRPAPGSVLVESGNPAPLFVDRVPGDVDTSEPLDDLDGAVRVSDSDGDGRARRDVGAFETPAAPFPVPGGNLLINPDAEAGPGDGAPPGWTVTGGFRTVAYGTMPFPSLRTGASLGGGARFFFADGTGEGAGAGGEATATQVVDVSGQAPGIDTGEARAMLSALVGGYRADADELAVRATFRGPSGAPLGVVELARADPEERGNATNLLARSATGSVPATTRSIEVSLRATKAAGGVYTDAYADNLGLTLAVPPPPGGGGCPGGPGPGGPEPPRPFSGILVLDGSATLARATGRAKILVGCATATAGRCQGDIVLEAALVRRAPRVLVGRARVSLAPGASRRVSVKFAREARVYLRTHTRLRVRVNTSAVDGQGLRRSTTVPVTVRPSRRRAATR